MHGNFNLAAANLPQISQEMHYILAAFLSLVVAAVGLCILIWMSFDALQMQGR
jgi:hypothetical protein